MVVTRGDTGIVLRYRHRRRSRTAMYAILGTSTIPVRHSRRKLNLSTIGGCNEPGRIERVHNIDSIVYFIIPVSMSIIFHCDPLFGCGRSTRCRREVEKGHEYAPAIRRGKQVFAKRTLESLLIGVSILSAFFVPSIRTTIQQGFTG